MSVVRANVRVFRGDFKQEGATGRDNGFLKPVGTVRSTSSKKEQPVETQNKNISRDKTTDRKGQATKSARGMPWHWEPMKDVVNCDKLRGVVSRRYIRRFPNGATRL